MSLYLLFSQDLFQVFEHDALDRVNHHPEGGKSLPDQLLSLVSWVSDVEHDVTDDVVVEDEGSLLRQLGDELDEGADDLEDLDGVLPCQLLHEKLEEEVTVVDQTRPYNLSEKNLSVCQNVSL